LDGPPATRANPSVPGAAAFGRAPLWGDGQRPRRGGKRAGSLHQWTGEAEKVPLKGLAERQQPLTERGFGAEPLHAGQWPAPQLLSVSRRRSWVLVTLRPRGVIRGAAPPLAPPAYRWVGQPLPGPSLLRGCAVYGRTPPGRLVLGVTLAASVRRRALYCRGAV